MLYNWIELQPTYYCTHVYLYSYISKLVVPLYNCVFLLMCVTGASPGAECIEGDVRLAGGLNNMGGRVEICNGGVWGSACNHNFTEPEARVVCNQLGFTECKQSHTSQYVTSSTCIYHIFKLLLCSSLVICAFSITVSINTSLWEWNRTHSTAWSKVPGKWVQPLWVWLLKTESSQLLSQWRGSCHLQSKYVYFKCVYKQVFISESEFISHMNF